MDIQEFVRESLLQIAEGVAAAKTAKPSIAPVIAWNKEQTLPESPLIGNTGRELFFLVEFDLAVTATAGTAAGGSAGISVAGWLSAGGKKESSSETTSTNRIRFSVPISFREGFV